RKERGNAPNRSREQPRPCILEAPMPSASRDLVIFEIENVRYALPSSDVQEVVRAVAVVPLPKAPPVVEGIIDVRGRVVPVLDLRARFGLPPRVPRHTDHLVLARAHDRLVGVRADRAIEVARVEPGDLELPDAA